MYRALFVCAIPGVSKSILKYLPRINPEIEIITANTAEEAVSLLWEDRNIDVVVCEHSKKIDAFLLHDELCSSSNYTQSFIFSTDDPNIENAVRAIEDRIEFFIYRTGSALSYCMELSQKIVIAVERKKMDAAHEADVKSTNAVLTIANLRDHPFEEALNYALEACVDITNSEIGYIGQYTQSNRKLRILSWSITAMGKCRTINRPMEYDLDASGLWGDPIRLMKPVIIDDYKNESVYKKNGLPEGHVELSNLMMIPLTLFGIPVATAGVGNKKGRYTEEDESRFKLVAGTLVSIFQSKFLQKEHSDTDLSRNILDGASCGLVLVDSNMSYKACNYIASDLIGMSEHTLTGKLTNSGNEAAKTLYRSVHNAITSRMRCVNYFSTIRMGRAERYAVDAFVNIDSAGMPTTCLATFINTTAYEATHEESNISNAPRYSVITICNEVHDFVFRNRKCSGIDSRDWEILEQIIAFGEAYKAASTRRKEWRALKDMIPQSDKVVYVYTEIAAVSIEVPIGFECMFSALKTYSASSGASRSKISTELHNGEFKIVCIDNGIGMDDHTRDAFNSGSMTYNLPLMLISSICLVTGLRISDHGKSGNGLKIEIIIPDGRFRFD